MSKTPNCYYYDEQHNRCKCYANENLDELLAENAKLRVERDEWHRVAVSKQDIIDHMRDARAENAKLRELVAHLMYVKPNDVNAILHKGKLLRFDDLLAEVGMRWESEVD